ncbi:kelch repeat and BTB domain-containing protein 4 [Drosophila santomea]|uniref:kelch repeat and BTB domain-containing protein 4 n=1 Tax=Drosophila santomea TaxID=129105 RepID=UPI0019545B19|nr:kelch repeat and BTB domain-containing protein 4 [Drosophila santomea]
MRKDWQNFTVKMSSSLRSSRGIKLMKSGLFSDVCIRIDCTGFQCHKIILACASEFFEKLFQKDLKEFLLDGTTPEVFQIFLDFMYAPDDKKLCKLTLRSKR